VDTRLKEFDRPRRNLSGAIDRPLGRRCGLARIEESMDY
jgi:hypothetical protein